MINEDDKATVLFKQKKKFEPISLIFSPTYTRSLSYQSMMEVQCPEGFINYTIESLSRSFLQSCQTNTRSANRYVILLGSSNPLSIRTQDARVPSTDILHSDHLLFQHITSYQYLKKFLVNFRNELLQSSLINEQEKQLLFIINDLPLLLRNEVSCISIMYEKCVLVFIL